MSVKVSRSISFDHSSKIQGIFSTSMLVRRHFHTNVFYLIFRGPDNKTKSRGFSFAGLFFTWKSRYFSMSQTAISNSGFVNYQEQASEMDLTSLLNFFWFQSLFASLQEYNMSLSFLCSRPFHL